MHFSGIKRKFSEIENEGKTKPSSPSSSRRAPIPSALNLLMASSNEKECVLTKERCKPTKYKDLDETLKRGLQSFFNNLDPPHEDELTLCLSAEQLEAKVCKEFEYTLKQSSELSEPYFKKASIKPLKNLDTKIVGSHPGCVVTHKGSRYDENQDGFVSFSLPLISLGEKVEAPLYALFDGHGGRQAAFFCENHLQENLSMALETFNKEGHLFEITNSLSLTTVRLNQAFKAYMESAYSGIKNPGTTAVMALFVQDKAIIANLGDSRAILFRKEKTPLDLSFDFKATSARGKRKVINRGGTIIRDRVQGSLAITRAIGDEYLKDLQKDHLKVISSKPAFTIVDLKDIEETGYILLASDGLTDVASNQELHDFIFENDAAMTLELLTEAIVKKARKAGSRDDITVCLIPIKRSKEG